MASRALHLTNDEANLLNKIAHRSKMDCWLYIDNQNRCRDLENGNKVISTKRALKDLIEGLTEHDVECITPAEILVLLSITHRLL